MFPPRLFLIYLMAVTGAWILAWLMAKKKIGVPAWLSGNRGKWWLIFLTLVSAVYFSALNIQKYRNFTGGGTDLAIFGQAMWNIIHGQAPVITFENVHLLAEHFSPIWYLLAPLFSLCPSIYWLILLSAVFFSLQALVLYSIAHEILGSTWLALAFAVSFLADPYGHLMQIGFVHAENFYSLFVCLALWAYIKRKWTYYWFFMFLALTGKEDVGLYFAVFGATLCLVKETRTKGFATLAIGCVWAVATFKVFMPHFGPYYMYTHQIAHFSNWGTTSGEIFANLAASPWKALAPLANWEKIFSVCYFSLQTGGLIFLGGLNALPYWCAVALRSIMPYPGMYNFWDHYAVPMLPFLYIASFEGCRRLQASRGSVLSSCGFPADRNGREIFLGWFLLLTALFVNFEWGSDPLSRQFKLSDFNVRARSVTGLEIMDQIPDRASVLAQHNLTPHLAFRKEVYCIISDPALRAKTGPNGPDFVVFDLDGIASSPDANYVQKIEANYHSNKKYILQTHSDGFEIFKKVTYQP